VCGISRTCFRVLQDERNLSVHFLLDVDGTLYQTLDLRDTAWHATKSNTRSIGVEIAQIGAYGARETWRLDPWYEERENETLLSFPPRIQETGIRTKDFVGRTARPDRLQGNIQGQTLYQYDFTPEQYQSLAKLSAALCREFPKIHPDAPRDEQGHVQDHVLDDDAWEEFHGILGHYHVQKNKTDPGPAFDWEAFLEQVREECRTQLPRTN
jgi:N-acetyl-anhydromuramyl-L-alanine amidase AmpD